MLYPGGLQDIDSTKRALCTKMLSWLSNRKDRILSLLAFRTPPDVCLSFRGSGMEMQANYLIIITNLNSSDRSKHD